MKKLFIILTFVFAKSAVIYGQYFQKWPEKGIQIPSKDTFYSVNLRFRIQSRAIYTTMSQNDFSAQSIEARVRRMRIGLEGFVLTKRLTYKIQLSIARGDMDWSSNDNAVVNNSPNVLRDAIVFYQLTPRLQIAFGQGKLPGNRQRVISSGQQQFVDRSIVNATFNIDRDFGIFANYKNKIGRSTYWLKSAISSGDGRNTNTSIGGGLCYTGRAEFLPFGDFTNGGDYFEGDLEREPEPKLSIASTISYNDQAMRVGGQLGNDWYQLRNLLVYEADILFKYKGNALYIEYMKRETNNPETINNKNEKRYIYEGSGLNTQLSHIFKNNWEIAGRYAYVIPESSVQYAQIAVTNYTLGLTKYLAHHKVKIQTNVMYQETDRLNLNTTKTELNNWHFMFQLELGI
jgi:hypothetical protein